MNSSDQYRRYAKRIKIFNGIDPDDVGDILHRGNFIEFQSGQTIFHKGQRGSDIFVVFRGSVNIYVDDKVIAICRVGDAFGEMSVLNHNPHCATAMAHTDVKLFIINENEINTVLEKHVAVRFLLNIIHVLSGHLEVANTMVTTLQKHVESFSK